MKLGVVLFNLGGPDGPDSVKPFLFNLFNDPAIISVPQPLRVGLATLISTTREKSAKANYAIMGGGSPLLPETQKQADALKAALQAPLEALGIEVEVFIAMRYWHPLVSEVAKAAKAWGAQKIIGLPLYPQFSTTTTASSWLEWRRHWKGKADLICCYPRNDDFVKAHAEAIIWAWKAAGEPENVRLLMSAHGLPERVVQKGDPYQTQVEMTAEAVSALLPPEWEKLVCYQSRVGPLKWIGPATEDVIIEAAEAGKTILLVPIAFVSEHIETLVELDVEYRELAEEHGCHTYIRAPALGAAPLYIDALAQMVVERVKNKGPTCGPDEGGRICAAGWTKCPVRI